MRDAYKDERYNSREKPGDDRDDDMFFMVEGDRECCAEEGPRDGLKGNKPMYRNRYVKRH